MRWGRIFWGLVTVIVIATIVGLCLRPATVIGVSEETLAYSLQSAADANEARCQELEDDFRFACVVAGTDGGFAVEVDDFGCWEARRGEELDGCITIADLIR
jgi:hypothetical protein